MNEKGILIIVSAPSGCGKSTVVHCLMEQRDNLRFSVSATTRAPREGEREGVDYFFVTRERFEEMVEAGEFLEHAEYAENCYGTPRAPVDEMLEAGYDVYLDIDVQGAMQVKAQRPDTLLIFLMPPGLEELRRRLVLRGTDSMEVIEKRLQAAEYEFEYRKHFDYTVVNDVVDEAVAEVAALIDAHRKELQNKSETIETEE